MTQPPLISVVDDDESVRESLPGLLRQLGFRALAFPSAADFLASGMIVESRCLVLDVAMPGMSGPDLQRELRRRGHALPIVFITANSDESMRLRLLAEGAADVLLKPFRGTALLASLQAALRMA